MKKGKTISIHLSAEDYADFARKISKDHTGLSDGAAAKHVLLRWLAQGSMGDLRIDSSQIDEMASHISEIMKVQSQMRAHQTNEMQAVKKLLAEIYKKINVRTEPMQSRRYEDDGGLKGLTIALNHLLSRLN